MKTLLYQLASPGADRVFQINIGAHASDRIMPFINALKKFIFLSSLLGTVSAGLAQSTSTLRTAGKLPNNTVITTVNVGGYSSALAVSPDSSTVYVANAEAGTVIVLDATNNYAIKATTTVGSEPEYLVVSPDGKKLYVSNYTEQGTVSVVDTTQTSYPVVATLSTGAYPAALAITPDGTELWVANYGSAYNQIPGTISVFGTAADNLKSTIATNGSPWLIAFAKKGKQADVLNYVGGGLIQFINTVSEKVSPSVGAAGQLIYPDGMTIDASGSTLYIADAVNYVSVCDAIHGAQTAQLSAVSSVYASYELGQPAVTKNGKYLYVPYYYDSATDTAANQVVMVDVSTGKIVGAPITVDYYPYWTQIAPDGQTLYVVSEQYGAGSVTVINITPQ